MLGKSELLNAVLMTNRGLLTTAPERQAIQAAIATLEDQNPHPRPLEVPNLLEGNWRLLYTTSQELLGIGKIPLLTLGEIYQCINFKTAKIYNIAEIQSLPLLEGVVSVVATITPTSERRVQVQFERSVIGLQRIVGYESPLQWVEQLTIQSRTRAIDLTISSQRQPGWLDITYLDQDLRIGRGNEGNLFVLARA
jgi:PAP_fibrillin